MKIARKIAYKKTRPVVPLPPAWALKTLTSKTGMGVYASSDRLFKGALFGRDSLEVAEDLLTIKPRLVKKILCTLASLQGEIMWDVNEEEPGKIIHEYRTAIVDGKPLDDSSRHIFDELSKRWGGDGESMAYYGSVDSTPHFVRVLSAYCSVYGEKILDEKISLRSGHSVRMRITLENSIDWIMTRLQSSNSGLLEYQRLNKLGIENQVWKDSKEFYVHQTGEFVNRNKPVGSIEVQGLVYDALTGAAGLMPNKSGELLEAAEKVRQKTLELYWQPEKNYFALGHDYTDDDKLRIISTLTANPASLLETTFFDGFLESDRQRYVGGIVNMIMSEDFLTDAGIRSRALKEAKLVPFWDYHGTYTTWPKETYDIAKGLRRQGFPGLARQLENRLLNVVIRHKTYPEFLYVDGKGRVLASSPSSHEHANLTLVDGNNEPERLQAWTISAIMAIMAYRLSAKLRRPSSWRPHDWQINLEKKILQSVPDVQRTLNPRVLTAKYPDYPYRLVRDTSKDTKTVIPEEKDHKH